jgi:hypothetical protein
MPDKETQITRSYDGIKAELLAGAFRPGERLESRVFETKYNTSSTTVRMALSRLAGEKLVETTALDGFRVPMISESWLYDMYIANRELLTICATLSARAPRPTGRTSGIPDGVAGAEILFNEIAAATQNLELMALVANVNERLRPVRLIEPTVLAQQPFQLRDLEDPWQRNDLETLSDGLTRYHQTRIDHLREIVFSATRARK